MNSVYRFGQFVLDPRRRSLSFADSEVSLTPKAFDVLFFLAQNPNRLVTKDELLQAVWGDTFVEEGNLKQYISHLRKALGDNSDDPRLIVTIPRRGYQFTERVTVFDPSDLAPQPRPQPASNGNGQADARILELSPREEVRESSRPRFRIRALLIATAALLTILAAAVWVYLSYRHPIRLAATDTIVLASLKNETSDPVFDDALDTALRYAVEQTPYLNVLGTDKVLGTLAQLSLPAATQLTADVSRQVCGKTNSRMVIAQSISDAGNGYHFRVEALDCASGATLAKEQADIRERGEIVHQLGVSVAGLRARLGEPSDSLARFNQPLEKTLTSSLEALQACAQGMKLSSTGDAAGALKLYQRALELDPDFAVTSGRMGSAYLFLGNIELSSASYTRTYQLRGQLAEKNRLNAEVDYYGRVTGDWEKEYSSVLQLLGLFPRDVPAHTNLRAAYVYLGQPARAADEAAEIARLRPNAYYFGSAIQSIRFASRFNDAKSWLAKADALKFDNSLIRRERLIVAFATRDRDNVEKILKEEEQGPYREAFLNEHSLIDVQQGRFNSAERLRLTASGLPSKGGKDDWWVVLSALEAAEVGKDVQARRYETKAAGLKLDRNNRIALALALARSGQTAEAGTIADEISAQSPEDTLVQHYFVPTIRAAIKLHQHDPAASVDLLRGSAKYELAFTGSFETLYPAYIRGLAYLNLGDGRSAATEFQKLIDNPGFSVRHVTGPLAWLQLGRAQKMMGDELAARKSYGTFLDLWKSADPGTPIYQQAKAEYAKLTN
jgi:eukaryotic-like serine/threonine-protein kinase